MLVWRVMLAMISIALLVIGLDVIGVVSA